MANDGDGAVRVVGLRIDNFKRIEVVELTPEGAVVEVTGKNAQGKSSVLDAIQAALGGGRAAPEMPIRHGEAGGSVEVDLGTIVVRRSWRQGKSPQFIVTEKGTGQKLSSPQAVLDELCGQLSFDPLGFTRLAPADQEVALLRCVGFDVDAWDAERKALYEDRRVKNKKRDECRAVVRTLAGQLGVDEDADVEASVSLSVADAKVAKHSADVALEEYRNTRRRIDTIDRDHEISCSRRDELTLQIEELVRKREDIEAKVATLKHDRDTLAKSLPIDGSALMGAVEDAAADLEKAQADEARAGQVEAFRSAQMKHENAEINAVDADKLLGDHTATRESAIQAADLPIDGLGVSDGAVWYNGVPLAQASQAQQLRVSVALGIVMNPKLRVMLVREGSVLDSDGMRVLHSLAEEHGLQVWVERVTDGGPVGVVIEDGNVQSVNGPSFAGA